MLTPQGLFFAPDVRFKDLKVDDPGALAHALAARAEHWFFRPAATIASSSPFAAGIIVACFIDAAAEFAGKDVVRWLREAVPDSAKQDKRRSNKSIADSFKEDVRHGLVHNARLNRGAEFSLDLGQAMAVVGSVLVVNPKELLSAVQAKWNEFLASVRVDPVLHRSTADRVKRVFSADFQADATWPAS